MGRFELLLGVSLISVGVNGCIGETFENGPVGHDANEIRTHASEIVTSWTRDGDWFVSPAIESDENILRIGTLLTLDEGGEMPLVEARIGDAPWTPVASTWSEVDQHVGVANFDRTGTHAELRIEARAAEHIVHLQWSASMPLPDASEASPDVAATQAPLESQLEGLGIVTRQMWGARATRCGSRDVSKSRMAIHHTVTGSTDPARQMRGIQRYHMDSRGWCDVGYHFLIGSDGKVYEGRPFQFSGAHVGGNNSGNIGISFIGCFNSTGCAGLGSTSPPQTMINTAGNLVGSLSRRYGIAVNRTSVKGHRDHKGQSTSCPGSNLHPRLDDIRRIATSQPQPTPPSGDICLHTFGGTYGNQACSAGYQCCDGRWGLREACGTCRCTETTGTVGCSGPPAGATCRHTFGGTYANTGCSPSYQCCDGRWRTRGSCGSCYCEEATGSAGCGG